MPNTAVHTPAAPQTPMQCATGSRWLFLPGHTALGPDGVLDAGADLIAQTKAVYRNLATSLAEVGADFSNLVKLNAFVVGFDADDPDLLVSWLTAVHEVADELGQPQPPMMSMLGVQTLAVSNLLIEIEGIAVLD